MGEGLLCLLSPPKFLTQYMVFDINLLKIPEHIVCTIGIELYTIADQRVLLILSEIYLKSVFEEFFWIRRSLFLWGSELSLLPGVVSADDLSLFI